MKNINIITLGCSKNTYDSELLIGGLKKNNFNIVDDIVDSDCVIINTCGFLDDARKELSAVTLIFPKIQCGTR